MKCVIVDNEIVLRKELKYFINTFSRIEIEKEFDNGADALRYLSDNEVDVVFLEIDICRLNGMDLAKILYEKNKDIRIIFVTNKEKYAVEAFGIHAFDYILKPYSKERMISALKRIDTIDIDRFKTNSDKISVIKEDKIYVIDIEDIYFIESEGKGIKIFTKNEEYTSKIKISEIEKRLLKKNFYKCHRCYIVNLKKINEIEPWFNNTYVLKFKYIDKEVPVSRKNVKEFREMLAIK